MIVSFEWEQFDDRLWRLARQEAAERSYSVTWAGDAYRDDAGIWRAMEPNGSCTFHGTADEAKKALASRVAPNGAPVTGWPARK